jgi:hypothetical protein
MKKTLFFASLLSLLVIFQSCDKDSVSLPSHPIEGLWIGTYNIQEAVESGDSFYYSFFIRNDDTIQVQGQGADGNTYYGIGTWTLADSVFHANITTTNLSQQGAEQNLTAIYDRKKGLLKEGRVESVGGFFLASFQLSRTD